MRILTMPILTAALVFLTVVPLVDGAQIQNRDALREMQLRAQRQMAEDRLEGFIEDAFRFFELSGELVAFRVDSELTPDELDMIAERSRELDEQAGRLISYIRYVAPYVRGETDGLWIIFDPPDETTTLEERLTLILALVNRMSPKLDQLTMMLSEQLRPTIPVEELQFEAAAPYLLVGGLEELRSMIRELRQSL